MVQHKYFGEILLLSATLIWGVTFIAQVKGMQGVGPHMFNAIRFLLGAFTLALLLPVPFFKRIDGAVLDWRALLPTALIGTFLFLGATLQQVGLQYTSVANASFITSTYIVIVPLAGFLFAKPATGRQIFGAIITFIGVVILSQNSIESSAVITPLNWGDFLELLGAFFWAAQIWCLSLFVGRYNNLHLAIWQSLVCGVLALLCALIFEENSWTGIWSAWPSLLFAGILSSGLAYTLQVFGQKTVAPGRAVFIFCLEAVFATIAGIILLNESVTLILMLGCVIIFAGIGVAQRR